jgi:hypothetical protein
MIGCEHYKYREKPPLAAMAFIYEGQFESKLKIIE